MEKFISGVVGALGGCVVAGVVIFSGLQARHPNLLFAVTGTAGAIGGVSAHEAVTRYRRLTRQNAIAPHEFERAIGRISERYALTPDRENVLVALELLRGEINGK